MPTTPAVLLIDSNADDRALSTLLLKQALPDAMIASVPDALALAETLLRTPPDVAIVASDLEWFKVHDLIAAIKRRSSRTAIVVLAGRNADITGASFTTGLALDGVVNKSVGGFLRLGAVVDEVLARAGNRGVPAQGSRRAIAPDPSDDLSDAALMFSHDLKEPVQQIIRLARNVQTNESPQRAGALQHVIECAERANSMLDGMVEYLSVTRASAPESIDLNQCLNRALQNLRTAIDEAHAEIRSAPLPVITGDERQMIHLFQNLVGNAIKFRGTERPVVVISVESRDDCWVFAIADNGIGIPEGATQRIFELGTRLHTREEFPGSGIGLALCKRIVERHGGRIWAKSQERGAAFYVSLPKVRPTSPSVWGNLNADHERAESGDDRRVRERIAH